MLSTKALKERIFFVMKGTQAEIGKALGVSQDTVSLWKRGKSKPTLEKLEVICEKTGVDMPWLLNGKTTEIMSVVNAYFPENSSKVKNIEEYQHAKYYAGYALICNQNELDDVITAVTAHKLSAYGITESPSDYASPESTGEMSDMIAAAKRMMSEKLKENESLYGGFIKSTKDIIKKMQNQFIPQDIPKKKPPESFDDLIDPPVQYADVYEMASLANFELPVIGCAAADNDQASRAEFYDDGGYDTVQIAKPHYKLVKVYGDSMEPVVLNGQYVLIGSEVKPSEKIRKEGFIGVIQVNCNNVDLPEEVGCNAGVCTFVKRIYSAGPDMLMLTSINASSCSPFTIMRANIMHLWPVRGVIFAGHGNIPED